MKSVGRKMNPEARHFAMKCEGDAASLKFERGAVHYCRRGVDGRGSPNFARVKGNDAGQSLLASQDSRKI